MLVALASWLGACADQTSLLIEVSSPLAIPDDVDGLELSVRGDAAGSMVDRTYELSGEWPHSVSLRPGTVESQGVTITVTATHGGAFVARRVVHHMFVRGEARVVRVVIDAECAGVTCGAGVDCVGGRCQQSTMDGGVTDGGVMDAGCAMNSECDDDVDCTIDTCESGACRNEPSDAFCQEGFTCDATMGCPPRVCVNDGECSDGVVCNGAEVCVDMACQAGEAIDCNDGDGCTSDRCDESMRGMCVHTTVDLDEDGFGDLACPEVGGVAPTDCNAANPDVNPDAVEACDGLDNDCNSMCDDAFTCCRGEIGTCMSSCGTTGTRVCGASCSWGVCSPPPEECNAIDDDCNGAADDIFACVQGASESCTTGCGSTGTRTCQGDCTWSECVAPAETCNGIDDDCNGTPDDGFSCVAGSSTSCTTSCGSTGTRTCDASCTMGSCTAPAEGCNGVDDDCDGNTDETVECSPGAMTSCTTSCGSTGTQTCSSMCMFGTCAPPAEVCNGSDDDCDGRIDNGFTCVPGATGPCTTSCGTSGMRTCTSSCTWGTCMPPVEACNGADDDCDTRCDETFTCCAGSPGTCMTSCGTMGTRTCSSSCAWSVCSPPAETCNGTDDDCNGACDDGFACCAGRTGTCTTMCGSTGTRTCSGSCAWGTCSPPSETCNGMDDDCDGSVDNGFACSPGAVQSCTTSCGSTGTQTCGASCTYGSCTAPLESCNGTDDDCDGMTDEGCGVCTGCTGAVGVSAPGGRYTVTLGPHAQSGSCGGAGGSEGYLTFTLTQTSDVFVATHQAGSIDTVLYVRACTCTGSEVAGGCNDDADSRTTSRLRLRLPAGTYNVVVDTKSAMTGTVPVDLYISPAGNESDRCGNPTFLAAGTTTLSGTTCGFTADESPVTSSGCPYTGSGDAEDRVFYFYLPTARSVTFSGCTGGTSYDQTLFVRSVCADASSAAQLACNDDGCTGSASCGGSLRSAITVSLPAGLHYFFVDGYLDPSCACGPYTINISGI